MFKNVAAKFIVFGFDATTNLPKTGDAANITAYVSKDYGTVTVLADTSATEMDATNAPGYYLFDAAQGETNGDCLMVSAKSSTSNIKVLGAPAVIYTRPTTGWLAPTTAGRTLDVSAGGEAGVDWANVGSPTTSLALTGTTIAVTQKVDVDTIKTNPVVNAGTITFPTTATLASTTNITAGTITTVTTLTNLPAIPANWLTAAGIAAAALNGKGDWLLSSGYTAPSNLTAAQIATGVWQDTTAGDFTTALSVGKSIMNGVALGTGLTINAYTGNTAQTGDAFARLGAPAGASTAADIAAVKVDTAAVKVQTDKLTFTVANVIDANMLRTNGDATSAANVAKTTRAIVRCTVGAASSATSIVTSACSPAGVDADQFKGRIITFDADTATTGLRGQSTDITASTAAATPTFTVTALTQAPASGDTFSVT